MAFGDRLTFARKQKKMTQGELGKKVGTSGDIIGKYERGENIPSIDVAANMAEALGVTLDYLVKDGEYEQIDNEILRQLKEVQAAYFRHHRCIHKSGEAKEHRRVIGYKLF